ncbi:MAG: hypothetical protein FVQ83_04970 [Chloroflexi bacterium]|nr:hypothetical protein [Chloroflexota bacterium]
MVKITKWLVGDKPTEDKIQSILESEGLKTKSWSEEAGTMKDPEPAGEDLSLCVIEGMARITLPDSADDYHDLMAGDRLDIPAGANHGLMVGPAGVKFIEGTKWG